MKEERLAMLRLPSAWCILVAHINCHHGQRETLAAGRFAKAARRLFGEITWWVILFREVLFFVSRRMGGQYLRGNEGRRTTVRNKYKK